MCKTMWRIDLNKLYPRTIPHLNNYFWQITLLGPNWVLTVLEIFQDFSVCLSITDHRGENFCNTVGSHITSSIFSTKLYGSSTIHFIHLYISKFSGFVWTCWCSCTCNPNCIESNQIAASGQYLRICTIFWTGSIFIRGDWYCKYMFLCNTLVTSLLIWCFLRFSQCQYGHNVWISRKEKCLYAFVKRPTK